MTDQLIPIIAILCTIGLPIAAALIWGVLALKGRHAERLSMIEKGIAPDESKKPVNAFRALRNGLVMMGLGLGLLIGLFADPYMPKINSDVSMSVPAFTVLFGGVGFFVYFFFSRKMQQKSKDDDKLI